MTSTKKTIESIQLLRGVACLLVVLLHSTYNYAETFHEKFLGGMFIFGGSGVDVFFVLSGFIITYTNLNTLSKPNSITGFIKKRGIRIFPIYWLIITTLLLLQFCLPFFYKTHFDLSFKNIAGTYLLLPDHTMVNGVSWSLTNELFFYLLFIIAFLIPVKKVSFYIMLIYLLFLTICGITNLSFKSNSPFFLLVTNPMNIEFFLGVISALVYKKLSKSLAYAFFSMGILLFIAGSTMNFLEIQLYTSTFNRVLLFGFPSFFVITGITNLEQMGKIKVHNVFSELGDASYSIYLFHLPVIAAFYKLLAYAKITNVYLIYLFIAVLLVSICVAGVVIYHKVEKPVIQSLNRLIAKKG